MEQSNSLCLFQLPDGTVVCRACDSPPLNSILQGPAPAGSTLDPDPDDGPQMIHTGDS